MHLFYAGYTSYRELQEHMHSDHKVNREDLELLQRVLSAQAGDQQVGEQVWLDEGTGVFLTVSRKEGWDSYCDLIQSNSLF